MTSVNAGPSWSLASPLTLLMQEEAHGDEQAEEVLLLSFTSDLGFLESFALGPAQAAGARVSVIADAAMTTLDPRAARRAGRSYLPGLASTNGAFHPKLVVIAGKERATVAIGSGNATLAGWQRPKPDMPDLPRGRDRRQVGRHNPSPSPVPAVGSK